MKRHSTDPFSLIAGLFVTGIAVVALTGPWRIELAAWVWPAALIVAGLVILALVLLGQRRADPPAAGTDAATDGAVGRTTDPEREQALAAARAELDEHTTVELERE